MAVADVLIVEVDDELHTRLVEELEHNQIADAHDVGKRLFAWLQPRLQPTLQEDEDATRIAADEAEQQVEMVKRPYAKGEKLRGIEGGPSRSMPTACNCSKKNMKPMWPA